MNTPEVDGLREVERALREFQREGASVQLHPGDLGWNYRFGAEATAAAMRTWSRDGTMLAIGMIDSPGLLRLALAPEAQRDEELARQIAADLNDPERGVLPSGRGCVEVRCGDVLRSLLYDAGWVDDEAWSPLRRDLSQPIEDCGLRIEVVGPERAEERAAVLRASFEGSTFSVERWRDMAAGSPYADAQCLLAYDDVGDAVASATIWSAGPGRPGLLEPVGVHRDHRGHGYGSAISVAAAAALRSMGSSSATVCTPSANVAAVATYASAGFDRLPEVRDLARS